jgi:hypothetical protein
MGAILILKAKIMKKFTYLLNGLAFISLMLVIYYTCAVCLKNDVLPVPVSIGAVHSLILNLAPHSHYLAVGLLPVYISCVIFGGLLLGYFFSGFLQRCLKVLLKKLTST